MDISPKKYNKSWGAKRGTRKAMGNDEAKDISTYAHRKNIVSPYSGYAP